MADWRSHSRQHLGWGGFLVLLAVLVWGVLTHPAQEPDLAQMKRVVRRDYAAILWEDREYVPWGAVTGGRGKLLGYVDGDKRDKVYSYEDLPEEEWIANALDHDGIMLCREINVTEIPGELGESEYPWNP